jgi:thioredoxin reductase
VSAAVAVATNEHEATCVPGVYVVGNASHREQKIVVAAAEGTLAAIRIHESPWTEHLRRGLRDTPRR